VYRARDRRLNRIVAIKIVRSPGFSAERREQFDRAVAGLERTDSTSTVALDYSVHATFFSSALIS